ncbi:hypothetical protein M5D96_010924 [Drosophila gunungcola]|uniref:Uncharacterized protein n=1 Tax=Drosophila gunungcola TaxID=103775 RepID=A0A9P9YGC6_9MUSC|nr:hypothetical protein M5D96_010924 [Drosophila gunungcola]
MQMCVLWFHGDGNKSHANCHLSGCFSVERKSPTKTGRRSLCGMSYIDLGLSNHLDIANCC